MSGETPKLAGDPCGCSGLFEELIPGILACNSCKCVSFYHGDVPPHVFLVNAIRNAIRDRIDEQKDKQSPFTPNDLIVMTLLSYLPTMSKSGSEVRFRFDDSGDADHFFRVLERAMDAWREEE